MSKQPAKTPEDEEIVHNHPLMTELLGTLDLLLTQARTYERALPPDNHPARMAVASLSDLARRALKEAHECDRLYPAIDCFSTTITNW